MTGRGKRAIEDHFDSSFELEYTLVEKEKKELLEQVQHVSHLAKFSYVRQPKPLGDGHAILCAQHLVYPGESVAILFGDDLIDGKIPALKQLINVYEKYSDPVIALCRVSEEEVCKFGVVKPHAISERTCEIKNFVEKPKIEDAPSNLVAVGKYIITPEVFTQLEASMNDDGEIRLANAFVRLLENNKVIYGQEIEGNRYDCGDKFGFVQATIQMGLKHPEIKDKLKDYLITLKS